MSQGNIKIEYRKADELIPYARNSRTHDAAQVAQIAGSIKEFGFTNPILADKDGVVAGHGRIMGAQLIYKDGGTICLPSGEAIPVGTVPVLSCDGWSDAKRRAYVIADNKLALNAGWDEEVLRLEIDDLLGDGFDIGVLGFSQEELDAMTPEVLSEGLTDDDAVPELPESARTKLGDVWIMGRHRLMCGDSTDISAVELLMNGSKADMVFTDPPYGVDYKGINNDDRGGLEDLLRGAFGNLLAVSKSGASIYVFHSDRCADIFHKVFREFFHFSSMIIWAKNSLTLSQTDYQSQHEPCLYGWMNNGTHTWHSDRKQTSVWRFDKERVEGHTTPKPVDLVIKAISNSSKGGDSVIDLFGGSGSTLIACEKAGREGRLMELDARYCDVIVKRWQDFTGLKATLEADGRTFEECPS